jgi:H+/Cl- antiporter ClcA
MEQIGKILIIAGIIMVIAGLILYLAGNKLSWIGHLPGDINIVRENVRIFIPVTSMILLSVLLSLIIYIIRKFF